MDQSSSSRHDRRLLDSYREQEDKTIQKMEAVDMDDRRVPCLRRSIWKASI